MRRKVLIATAVMVVILMLMNCVAPIFKVYAATEKTEMNFNVNLYKGLKSYFKENDIKAVYNDGLHTIKMENSVIEGVKCLQLNNSAISDITGLDQFNKLEKLDLSSNKLSETSNLGVLNNLKDTLSYLNISSNQIADVSECEDVIENLIKKEQRTSDNIKNCSGIRMSNQNVRIVVDVPLSNTDQDTSVYYSLPQILQYSGVIKYNQETGQNELADRGYLNIRNTGWMTENYVTSSISENSPQIGAMPYMYVTDNDKDVELIVGTETNDGFEKYEGLAKLEIKIGQMLASPYYNRYTNTLYQSTFSIYYVVHGEETEGVIFNDKDFYLAVKEQLTKDQTINSDLLSYKYATKANGDKYYDVCDISSVNGSTVKLSIDGEIVYTIRNFDINGYKDSAVIYKGDSTSYRNKNGIQYYEVEYVDTLNTDGTVTRTAKVKIEQYNTDARNLYQDYYSEPYVLVITDSDIFNKITSLILNDKKIDDLTGIEKFVGLESNLNVSYNYIDTLANIYSLQLNKEELTSVLQQLYTRRLELMNTDRTKVETAYNSANEKREAIEEEIKKVTDAIAEAEGLTKPTADYNQSVIDNYEATKSNYDAEADRLKEIRNTKKTDMEDKARVRDQKYVAFTSAKETLRNVPTYGQMYLNTFEGQTAAQVYITVTGYEASESGSDLAVAMRGYYDARVAYETALSDYETAHSDYETAEANYQAALTDIANLTAEYNNELAKKKTYDDAKKEYDSKITAVKKVMEDADKAINGDGEKKGLKEELDEFLTDSKSGLNTNLAKLYNRLAYMYETYNKEYRLITLLTPELNYQTEEEYDELQEKLKTYDGAAAVGKAEVDRLKSLDSANAFSDLERDLIITGLQLEFTEEIDTISKALDEKVREIEESDTPQRSEWMAIESTMREIDLYSQAANYCLIKRMNQDTTFGRCYAEEYFEKKIKELEDEDINASLPKSIYDKLLKGTSGGTLFNMFRAYKNKVISLTSTGDSTNQSSAYSCKGDYYEVNKIYSEEETKTYNGTCEDLRGEQYIGAVHLFERLSNTENDEIVIIGDNKTKLPNINNLFFYRQLMTLANKFPVLQSDISRYIVLPNLRKLDVRNNKIETLGEVVIGYEETEVSEQGEGEQTVTTTQKTPIMKDLTVLNNLKEFYAGHNLVSGDISCVDWSLLKTLKKLDLSYNFITDILPLQVLEKLRYLDVSDNLLEGAFNLDIKVMPKLKDLILAGNKYNSIRFLIERIEGIKRANGYGNMYIDEYLAREDTINLDLSRQELEIDITEAIALEENNTVYEVTLPPIFTELEEIDTTRTAYGTTSSKGSITATGGVAYIPVLKEGAFEGKVKVIAANGYPEDVTTCIGIDTTCTIKYDVKNIHVDEVSIDKVDGEDIKEGEVIRMEAGASKTFSATLEGENIPDETVEWDLVRERPVQSEENTETTEQGENNTNTTEPITYAEGTKIDQNGKLTIDPNETATEVIIEATSNYDSRQKDILHIQVYRRTITKININAPEELLTGKEGEVFVEVKGTDLKVEDKNLQLQLIGKNSNGEVIELNPDTKLEVVEDFDPESFSQQEATEPQTTQQESTDGANNVGTDPVAPNPPAPNPPAATTNTEVENSEDGNLEQQNEKITEPIGKFILKVSEAEKASTIEIVATSQAEDRVVKKQERAVFVVTVKQRTITDIDIEGPESIVVGKDGEIFVEVSGTDLKEEDKAIKWSYVGRNSNGGIVELSENTKLDIVEDFKFEEPQGATQQEGSDSTNEIEGNTTEESSETMKPTAKAVLKIDRNETAATIEITVEPTSESVYKAKEKATLTVRVDQRTVNSIEILGDNHIRTGNSGEYKVKINSDHPEYLEDADKEIEWSIEYPDPGDYNENTKLEIIEPEEPVTENSEENGNTVETNIDTADVTENPASENEAEEIVEGLPKAKLSIAKEESNDYFVINVHLKNNPSVWARKKIYIDKKSVSKVQITSGEETVKGGDSAIYVATVTGEYLDDKDKTVTWSLKAYKVVENTTETDPTLEEVTPDSETKIDLIQAEEGKQIPNVGGGKLQIGAHETADKIKVIATSDFNNEKIGEFMVNVDKKEVNSVSVYEQGIVFALEGSGKTKQFTGIVKGKNLTDEEKEVSWSITGQNSQITEITDKGFLIVGEDETAEEITVTATSVFDNTKSGTSIVRIIRREVESVTISEQDRTVKKGNTYKYNAVVEGKNLEADNKKVTWSVTGFDSEGTVVTLNSYTKIDPNTGELTVGAGETAVRLEIKATSTLNPEVSGTSTANISTNSPDLPANLGYIIDEDDNIIGVSPDTSYPTFRTTFVNQEGYTVKVFRNGIELQEGQSVATGDVAKLYKQDTVISENVIVVKGDVNGDGTVSDADTKLVKAHRARIVTLRGIYFKAADVNSDKEITITDVKLILGHRGRLAGYKL